MAWVLGFVGLGHAERQTVELLSIINIHGLHLVPYLTKGKLRSMAIFAGIHDKVKRGRSDKAVTTKPSPERSMWPSFVFAISDGSRRVRHSKVGNNVKC